MPNLEKKGTASTLENAEGSEGQMVTQASARGKALRRKSNDEPSPEKRNSSKRQKSSNLKKKSSTTPSVENQEGARKQSSHFLDQAASKERQDKRSTRATKGKTLRTSVPKNASSESGSEEDGEERELDR